jgi:iron complex transport system substrate-binding protein
MKRSIVVLAAVLVILAVSTITYGAYTAFLPAASPSPSTIPTEKPTATPFASSTPTSTIAPTSTPTVTSTPTSVTNSPAPTPTPTAPPSTKPSTTPTPAPQNKTVTITDQTGANVTLTVPLKRIISLNAGMSEIIYALGGGDKLVGRGNTSVSPPAILSKPVAGASSTYPNMEVIFDLNPDLVIVDSMITPASKEQFSKAGIPVMIDNTSNSSRIEPIFTYLGLILGAEKNATDLINWTNYYTNLVSSRIANISLAQRPSVYLEVLATAWRTANTNSGYGSLINLAGGLNIAPTNTSTTYPTLSPEYVVEKNPDVIVVMYSQSPPGTLADLQAQRTAMLSRAVLSESNAVKNGRVYVFNSKLTSGLLQPIGLLYTAKCLYPTLFKDVDPGAIQTELYQKCFGIPLDGAYIIPLS